MARALTMEEILELQANSRSRGDYAANLDALVKSGDLAWDFSDLFPGKEPEAIRNSVNQNIAKLAVGKNWPAMKVLIDKETKHCIVVNMDKLAESQAESNETDEETETAETVQ